MNVLLPWTIHTYPGRIKAFAALVGGIKESTARDYLYRPDHLSKRAAERLATFCEERAAAFKELAEAFDKQARGMPNNGDNLREMHRQRRGQGG